MDNMRFIEWEMKSYDAPFNKYEQSYLNHINESLDLNAETTVKWFRESGYEEFKAWMESYNYELTEEMIAYMRNNMLEWTWNQMDINWMLDNLSESSARSCDRFMDEFYQLGALQGVNEIERILAYTPADERAMFNLRNNNFEYIRNLNESHKIAIRDSIFEGIAKNEGIQPIARRIRQAKLNPVQIGTDRLGRPIMMKPSVRAKMIARTEYNRARNIGHLQAYANYGVTEYELVVAKGACNICYDYEKGNPYSMTDISAPRPPIHPNCRCTVAAVAESIQDKPLKNPVNVIDYYNYGGL